MNHTVQIIKNFLKHAVPKRFKLDGSNLYDCPVCRGRLKLEVKFHPALWYCHKCGLGGKLSSDSRKCHTLDRMEYLRVDEDRTQYLTALDPQGHSPQIHYLSKIREFPTELIKDLRPHRGPSVMRVYLPVWNMANQMQWYTARAMFSSVMPKYYTPPMGTTPKRKHEVLWGLHRWANTSYSQIILCEGVFDAVWFPGALALMGKSIGAEQIEILRVLDREVIVILDGDAKYEAAKIVHKMHRVIPRIKWVRLPYGWDLDSLMRAGGKRDDILKAAEVV